MTISSTNRKTILYAAIIIAGLFFYFYYGVYKMLYANFNVLGQDFMHGFFAAENFFNGRTIYSMPPLVTPYYYFPPITFIFMPFAKLGEPEARTLWFLVCHILIGIAFWTVYSYGSRRGKMISAAAAAAVILFSTPIYQMLFTGNINILIFSGLALVYAALLSGRNRFVPAGVAFFSAIKIFPAIMMGVFIRRRNYSACGYFILAAAAVAAVSFAVFGLQSNRIYIQQLPSMMRFSGIFHAMSLTFFIKLFWPGVPVKILFLGNFAFLAALAALWWRASGKGSCGDCGPGMAVTDLFALTVIMVLVAPSSWPMYCAFFVMPFYFVVFSMLEGRSDFRFPGIFILVLLFMNFWEILYYHLPVSAGHLTARSVELEKGLHPVLFPLIFSLHFAANLALFGWILRNYRELVKNIERIGMVNRGLPEQAVVSPKEAE